MLERMLTVSQLADYIGGLLLHDPILRKVYIEGEVANFRRTAAGHCYFSLRDESASLRCVLFAQEAANAGCAMEDGMLVRVRGNVAMYAQQGDCQVYVRSVEHAGSGALGQELERLRAQLAALGYFDEARKRAVPAFARRIGIVTSGSGAVLHDICNVANRRFAAARLLLAPTAVQGAEAPQGIARAIELVAKQDDVDVIIVARGGGSSEDLAAFNTQTVVEAVVRAPCPVISAVGHETDYTLCDFAADVRAPTPSAAAELAVPDGRAYARALRDLTRRSGKALSWRLSQEAGRLTLLKRALVLLHPRARMEQDRRALEHTRDRLGFAYEKAMLLKRGGVDALMHRLRGASPYAALERGYALVMKDGRAVGLGALEEGDDVRLHMAGGTADVRVTRVDEGEAI